MTSSTPPSTSSESGAEVKGAVKYGSCLCQAVRFRVIGDPISNKICHCTHCKKVTGSAFMWNGAFEGNQIEMLQGEESLTKYSDHGTRSGHILDRYFCKNCGSNVFLQSLRPAIVEKGWKLIALGSLDGPIEWAPEGEVFNERRVPYLKVIKFAGKL